VQEYNFDHPDAFDTEQLLHCAETLKSGQPYQVPIYDFKTHQRRSDTFRQVLTLMSKTIIVVLVLM
jgi:uridine kinase